MKLILPLILSACPALADEYRAKPEIIVGEIGLHCPYEIASRTAAPDTVIGTVDTIAGRASAVQLTHTVPAILGLAFGVQLKLIPGASYNDVQVLVTHPPMGEDGTTSQSWSTDTQSAGWTVNMYRFDFPQELLPGTWNISLVGDGRVVFSTDFNVIAPPAGMTLEGICSGKDILS